MFAKLFTAWLIGGLIGASIVLGCLVDPRLFNIGVLPTIFSCIALITELLGKN